MPELPEVETVARQLKPYIRQKRLVQIKVFDKKLNDRQLPSIRNMQIKEVYRWGKQVVFSFSNSKHPHSKHQDKFIAIHLRMTGNLLWLPKKQSLPLSVSKKHLRAIFIFPHGQVAFVDPRRFGTVRVCETLEQITPQAIDPLTPAFTTKTLTTLLTNSSQPLKTWLLRQDRLVGIGNIYAAEILHRSKLHPQRSGKSLKAKEIKALHQHTKKVLLRAIKCAGTTFSNYSDTQGESGAFQKFLQVYDRESKPCRTCHSPILRLTQSGRSTFYCNTCQPPQTPPQTL